MKGRLSVLEREDGGFAGGGRVNVYITYFLCLRKERACCCNCSACPAMPAPPQHSDF